MWDLSSGWLSAGLVIDGIRYLWMPGLVWLQVFTNLLIGLAYLSIGLALALIIWRTRGISFEWLYLAAGVFIAACVFTHFMEMMVIWRPAYWLDGGIRFITAIALVGTAILLFPLVPRRALARALKERRRSEEALRLSEARFRLLVESIQDYAIFKLGPTGQIESWSPGARNINGYREEEIIGTHFSVFYPPEDVASGKPECDLKRAVAEERFEDEGWRVRQDGSRFYASIILTALRDRSGNLQGFSKIARDITARKRAEKLAQERGLQIESLNYEMAALLDTLFQTAPVGLAYLDRDLRFVRINDRMAEMNGLPIASQLGQRLDQLFPDLSEARATLQRVLQTGESVLDTEVVGAMPAVPGKRRCWLASYYPVPLEGQTIGVGTVVHEITELKEAQQERERLLQQAQEGVRARDVFLAIAAHEMKSPLTPLRFEVEGLLRAVRRGRTGCLTPEHTARLEVIERQISRLDHLVNDLLDVSRIAARRIELNPEEMDLGAVVRDVIQRHAEELKHAGSSMKLCADAEAQGSWDRSRVEQVVTNLLTNAIKYGRGKPIAVAVRADDKSAYLTVADEGIGIAEEHQERIFHRFERAASDRHYGGLGLGLWLVQQAVEAMKGTVRVRSELGVGSTFTVELPRSAGPMLDPATCTQETPCHAS